MMESILGCDAGPREPNSKLTTSSKQPRLLLSASSLTIAPVLVFLGGWRVLRPLPCLPFHNWVNEITKLTFVAKKHPQIRGQRLLGIGPERLELMLWGTLEIPNIKVNRELRG